MTHVQKAMLWAAAILVAAYCASEMGLTTGASFGITMGLVGAAWASIEAGRRRSCKKACN
ncbi:hypothetical protein INR77_02180 [Erythrobacter sp. SCSIO 43205]|uniref:hypothetical protein n=1 Tax=Erythrobacter sp. SCSIO 43205 TaxID=2779361 RepID=UPI001CA8C6A5|nr:hypothetical protein [Erythrobacter sp. SCSIO 43205]UAB78566.1 hypothetical protein INR77_02180 [Erythrobacter sp. SCSIO 43205]